MAQRLISCFFLLAFLLTGCASTSLTPLAEPPATAPSVTPAGELPTPAAKPIEPYQDVRGQDLRIFGDYLDRELLHTLWFNQKTVWPDELRAVAADILEGGKNPGLGVLGLHARGITGKGVNVAIIDQNLVVNASHPEYAGKIVQYRDFGTHQWRNDGSMHGPAVTSLLVGETIGTAPGAKVYYAAVPTWTGDAQYYADALDWIVAENEKLPAGEKIRVVSVSAAPSGHGSPFPLHNSAWDEAYERAVQAGLLVLDCTEQHIVVGPCSLDPQDPGAVQACAPGWPYLPIPAGIKQILVPTAFRTIAEESGRGERAYEYDGPGGTSWSVPYLAGVLAMGWQVRPELSGEELLAVAFKTAYPREGYWIVNPEVFIEAIEKNTSP